MCKARVLALVNLLLCASAAARPPQYGPSYAIPGFATNQRLGVCVANAGDVNNDGHADLIVGAPYASSGSTEQGRAMVISGKSGAILRQIIGSTSFEYLGYSVSGAGDVNGDGFADYIIGSAFTASGKAVVHSGATGNPLYTFNGDSSGDQFGLSVSNAGDVNNDGVNDIIVGAPFDDNNGSNSGSARIFSGATGAIIRTLNGDSANDRFGTWVSGAGDVNNDGFDDVIVGAPLDDNNGIDSGSARVFSGANGAILYTFNGDSSESRLGRCVSGAGDVNGDGFADVIVGAFVNVGNGPEFGMARVYSGANGAILHSWTGGVSTDDFGGAVSCAGDINADGFDDLIVGNQLDDAAGTDAGSARIYSGATGAILWTFNGSAAGALFGGSVSRAGDVNADGAEDLIVGAASESYYHSGAGVARVFLSQNPAPPAPCPGNANGDTIVNFDDINAVIANWLNVCP